MAIFTAIATAISAVSAWTISLGALGTFAVGNFLLQTAVTLGASALAGAFKKPDQPQEAPFGIKGTVRSGGTVPRSFVMGKSLTAGSLVWHTEWGSYDDTPNAFYTQVIALSDLPVKGLKRWFVDGRAVTLAGNEGDYGFAALDYNVDGKEHAWVKFYDGHQIAADPFLVNTVSPNAPRSYSASRVGFGMAYAIVTFRVHREIFNGFPKSKFVLDGVPMYDITKDTSAGGNGPQRWADQSTWGGDGDELPAVQAYNLARGIYYKGEWFYGLQGLTAARLPASHWITQVEKCRAQTAGEGGMQPLYRSSGEITVNGEIGQAFEAILTACAGRMSEVGGIFKLYVGAPDAPVAHFEDADIVSLAPQSFSPFFGLSDTVNGVIGRYPSPAEGYVMRSTPPLYNPDFEDEDGKRRLMADVELSLVPYPAQAQRLLQGELATARRARRHTHTLPARFRKIEPGDTVTWSSVRNGYETKQFRVDGIIDLPNCDLICDLTEVDPADHGSWDHARDYRPVEPLPLPPVRPTAQGVVGFTAVAADIKDGADAPRRPGILFRWNETVDDIAGIIFEIRLRATGEVVLLTETRDFEKGQMLVEAGLVNKTDYEARAKYIPGGARRVSWTAAIPVTTNDTRLGGDDLAPGAVDWATLRQTVRDQIDSAGDANVSAQAAGDAATASAAARDAAQAAETGAANSATASAAARDAAQAAETGAANSATASAAARDAAQAAETGAGNSATASAAARDAAQAAETGAASSATASAAARDAAQAAETGAGNSATASAAARDAAQAAETGAGTSKTAADAAKRAAEDAETAAAGSASAAAGSASAASASETAAGQSASAANSAKVAAQTARDDASGSATAAASSASAADASETAAGQSASAANSAKVAAETARDGASGSATAAAGSASAASASETAAGQSASAANSAKVAAQTARDDASGSASAAASSASAASASETAAGQSASSANSAKLAAETARGAAQTARDAAATSETNAAGSASAASASEGVAAEARTAVVKLQGNPDFEFGFDGWKVYNGWVPDANSGAHGEGNASLVAGGFTANSAIRCDGQKTIHSGRFIPVDTSRTYRGRFRVRCLATSIANAKVYLGAATYDAAKTHQQGGAGSNRYFVASGLTVPNNGVWYEYEGLITGEGDNRDDFRAETVFISLQALINYTQGPDVQTEVDFMSFEDVTDLEAAEGHATAAASSASAADAAKTAAASSASAANSAKVAAEAARDNASGSASAAASSASAADASETAAASSASAANSAKVAAQAARDNASGSATAAASSASAADASETAAASSATAANSAKVAAQTARDDASGSATAAAGSASAASASETAAGQSASAANSAKVAAQTARDDASGSATAAAGSASAASASETAAGQSASAANSAKVAAETARDNASGSASAAASSASAASASETAAGQSASSANSAKLAAETARGAAQTARDAAASSETNAAGSASAAAASESVSAGARDRTLVISDDAELALGADTVTDHSDSSDLVRPFVTSSKRQFVASTDPEVGGQELIATDYVGVRTRRRYAVDRSRRYRLTFRVKLDAAAVAKSLYLGVTCYLESGGPAPWEPAWSAGSVNPNHYFAYAGPASGISADTWVTATADFDGAQLRQDAAFIRPLAYLNYSGGGGTSRLSLVKIEDITESAAAAGHASAAASSASAADASKTAAASSASAANSAKVAAEAARDNASGSASAAASSASAADASETAAASSASAANSAKVAAQAARDNASGSASAAASSASAADASETAAASSASAANSAKVAAQTARDDASGSASAAAGSASAASASETAAGQSASSANSAKLAAQTARDDASGSASAAAGSASAASASETAAGQSASSANSAKVAAETARDDASGSASAAASSASAAGSSQTAAASSASAANSAKLAAQTARDDASGHAANAGTAETNSVTARQGAEAAEASAVSAKDTAVAVSSQGTGVLSDQFMPKDGGGWVNWSAGPVVRANERYPTGKTFEWNIGAGTGGASMHSNYASWVGAKNASGYRIEIDFELVSGSINGAGFLFDWNDGATKRVGIRLDDMVPEAITTGRRYVGSAVVERPSNVNVGSFGNNLVYLMANYTGNGLQPTAAKHLKVHRVQFYPISQTEASVSQHAASIASLEGYAAATFSFRTVAGSSGAELELIASDSPEGAASLARLAADNILLEGSVSVSHLSADVLTADNITAGTMSVARLDVNEVLDISAATGGFAMDKFSPYDLGSDGIYMGRTQEDGSVGFGFAMSYDNGTFTESIQATSKTGLKISNGRFYRNLSANAGSTDFTNVGYQEHTLNPSIKRLDLRMMAGGGGGSSGDAGNGGGNGGNTVVELWDGGTHVRTWTANGGVGPSGNRVFNKSGTPGQSTAWGTGGAGGVGGYTTEQGGGKGASTVYVEPTPGGDATGYGAAGGGGGGDSKGGHGGYAGQFLEVPDYDVSALSSPRLKITVGGGGAKGDHGAWREAGGNGAPGRVQITQHIGDTFQADVIPLRAQATGTMQSHGPFPDLGAGLWVLFNPYGGQHLGLTDVVIDNIGGAIINDLGASITFVSEKTPQVVSFGFANRTIKYRFYRMG